MTEAPADEKSTDKSETSNNNQVQELPDADAILRQVEFYFGDANLPKDKFLWKLSQKDEGWVPISTVGSFSRMKKFPQEHLAPALRQSESLLEVSEDGKNVRRRVPLVEPSKEERAEQFSRTVYAKGFGDDSPTLQEDIERWFEQFGTLKQVRLRRADAKKFKGSVFAEFSTMEEASKFLNLDPKPRYKDNELLTMGKQAYVDMKAAEHGFASNAAGSRPRRFNAFRDAAKNQQNKKRRRGDDRRDGHKRGKRQESSRNSNEDGGTDTTSKEKEASINSELVPIETSAS